MTIEEMYTIFIFEQTAQYLQHPTSLNGNLLI